MSIGLATLRLDGFASLDASFDGGTVVTTPTLLEGETLALNVKADYGEVRVELLDADGAPLPEYSAEDCLPIHEDGVAVPVRWRNRISLTPLVDQPCALRLTLKNARLYSYRCL